MTEWARARRLYKSPRFQGAFVAGVRAARAGEPESACPYANTASWARSYRRAWLRGHRSEAL